MVERQAVVAGDPEGVVGRLKRLMIDHALPLWSTEG